MVIESLYVYPVKGVRGVALRSSVLELRGLAHDRRWMVVDEQGNFLSQREVPLLARLTAAVTAVGLRVDDGRTAIEIARPGVGAERVPVTLWKQALEGYLASPDAHAWFSHALGRPCRLVYQGDLPRQVSRAWAPDNTHTSYADGFPLLMTNTASLDDLNRRLKIALPMNRFRPSIVVGGASPWAEDGWKQLSLAGIPVAIVKPCLRCIVTTTDQTTGHRDGDEPLATLKTFRQLRRPGLNGVAFGQNAIPQAEGVLSVGDQVELTPSVP